MKHLHRLLAVASAAIFIALGLSAALAQNAGTVTNHAFAIGKGAGTTGFTSMLCTSAQLAVGQAAADPLCKTITGDVTISAAGVTAIGATKVTSAMLNADVLSTAHTWTGQQTFVAPVLGTPASGNAANLTGTASGLTAGNVTTNANLTGDVTSVGNATTLTNAPVIAKLLTGFTSGAGTVTAADSILSAIQKVYGNDALKLPLAGGTMSGNIAMGGFVLTGAGANYVTNTNLAQAGAATFKGNPTATNPANVQDFTVQGLSNLASPSATLDLIPIYNHTTGAIQNVSPSQIAAAVGSGVTSLNGATGAVTLSSLATVNVVKVQKFTASGTYTPSTGLQYAVIECVGPGGGGGGTTGATNNIMAAAAGGGGSYSRVTVSAATIGASQTVTVGAGGTGGSSAGGAGSAGGSDTSVGTICVAKAGQGAAGGNNGVSGAAGGIGASGTGDLTISGQAGTAGYINSGGAGTTSGPGSNGGSSGLGFGMGGAGVASLNSGTTGRAGGLYGGGGGGGLSINSATGAAGGAGAAGIVVITEYTNQ